MEVVFDYDFLSLFLFKNLVFHSAVFNFINFFHVPPQVYFSPHLPKLWLSFIEKNTSTIILVDFYTSVGAILR